MIKGYKGFLESKEEDVNQDLLEHFLDLEDEFRVDVRIHQMFIGYLSIQIVTLSGFKTQGLLDLLKSLKGIIERLKLIGDFTPRGVDVKGKWGVIEGSGRSWYRFGDLDIIHPEAMFVSMTSRGEFRDFYPQEIRGMSIWLDFIPS